MINIRALLSSMKFLLIPTASVFGLIFLYFLNVQEFITFITNNSGLAGFIRVALGISEVVLCAVIYNDEVKNINIEKIAKGDYDSYRAFRLDKDYIGSEIKNKLHYNYDSVIIGYEVNSKMVIIKVDD